MSNNQNNSNIGSKLKALRVKHGLSLNALAANLGMSYSWLWGLENDKHSITIVNLQRLCEYFDVDMIYFFTPSESTCKVKVIKKDDVIKYFTSDGVGFEIFTAGLSDNLEVTLITHPPYSPTERRLYNHKNGEEEFIHVLEGALFVQVVEQVYMIEAGESIVFDSRLCHTIYTEAKPSKFFLISSPPYNSVIIN